jgi:toxin secretion/phage lysis holin
MKTIWVNTQLIFTAVGGWLGWFLGGFDGFLYALVAFVVMDYITGVMLAILEKRLSSTVGAKGIFKKVLIFTLVAIGHIIDSRIIGDGSIIRTAVIFFYLSNEGISILENASRIGLPIPQKLKDILEQLYNRDGKEESK